MKIRLICISDSDKHFSSAIDEYSKRMGKSLEIIKLKPVKSLPTKQIIAKETQLVLSALKSSPPCYTLLLSFRGKLQSTEELVSLVDLHQTLTCVIWWPFGLDEDLLMPHVQMSLSLWRHTMPHGLAQLVWIEQLYRIQQCLAWKPYHY